MQPSSTLRRESGGRHQSVLDGFGRSVGSYEPLSPGSRKRTARRRSSPGPDRAPDIRAAGTPNMRNTSSDCPAPAKGAGASWLQGRADDLEVTIEPEYPSVPKRVQHNHRETVAQVQTINRPLHFVELPKGSMDQTTSRFAHDDFIAVNNHAANLGNSFHPPWLRDTTRLRELPDDFCGH